MTDFLTNHYFFLPLQHHETAYEPHLRVLMKGSRVASNPQDELYVDSLTEGPVTGWLLLDSRDQEVYPRLWSQTCPVTRDEAAQNVYQPRSGSWDVANAELSSMAPRAPFDLAYPIDYPGVIVSGTNLDSQSELLSPSWSGLVCPTRGGTMAMASAVWDCDDDDRIDRRDGYAPISSAWQVYTRPVSGGPFGGADPSKYMGLAWQLGASGSDKEPTVAVSGLGMCVESGFGRKVFGAASIVVGGPFEVGNEKDKHRIDGTQDGEPINALHLSTETLWIRPTGDGDAPQEDSGLYRNCIGGPILTKTYWRYDPDTFHNWRLGVSSGLWRWQTSAFIAAIPDRTPPKEKIQDVPGPKFMVASILDPKKPIASTVGEIGIRGMVLRESANWKSFSADGSTRDDRSRIDELDSDGIAEWRDASSIIRLDVAANPNYTEESRYSRVSSGTAWYLPAEMGLEDHIIATNQGQAPQINYATIGKRYLGMAWGVGLAWGKPALNSPWLPGVGFSLEYEPAGTFMRWYFNSNTGSQTTLMTMLSSGNTGFVGSINATTITASASFVSDTYVVTGAAKTLTLEQDSGGSWGTDRTQVYQDADGTIALLEADQEFSGDLELSGALSHTGSTVGFLGATPSAQGSAIPAPTAGATIDSEARTAINSIRAVLAGFGFIAS